MVTAANAEPQSHDYPPVKLRGYGTLSGTFTPGTIDGKPVSTLRIVCEDESKAKLVQAKYLSDLQTLPGVKPVGVSTGQATLPGLEAEDQGVFLAARNGTTVTILSSPAVQTESKLVATSFGTGTSANSYSPGIAVPMYLDRWDKYGFRFYYGPDKAFSREHFKSDYGKTEMWLVLATRPGANIFFGFKEGANREQLDQAVKDGDRNSEAFTRLLQEFPAKAGDVWLIPAKAAHAIGAGCLILEVQEPTDFTIQPERWCDTYRLSEQEMYLGLEPKTALEVFDLSLAGRKAAERWKKTPSAMEKKAAYLKESLITYDDTTCFAVNRHTLRAGGECQINGPAVFVFIDGTGFLQSSADTYPCKKGDYFFLPHAAGQVKVSTTSNLQWVECLPSKRS